MDFRKTISLQLLCVPLLATLFFVMGDFDFFDVLGIRREAQVALLGVLVLMMPPILIRRSINAIREPLFLSGVFFTLARILGGRHSLNGVLGMASAALLVAVAFSLTLKMSSRVLKAVIVLAAVFAALAIVEFFVLLVDPDLAEHTVIYALQPSYDLETAEPSEYTVSHPVAYLGLTPGEARSVFGVVIPRMQSFAREPGLLLLFSFVPGVLALTYEGWTRRLAVPLFALSFLGLTGTIYASIAIALVMYLLSRLPPVRGRRVFLTWIPLLVSVLGVYVVQRTTLFDELLTIVFRHEAFLSRVEYLEFLDRYESATIRLRDLRAFTSVMQLGAEESLPASAGLIMHGLFEGGLVGATLNALLLYSVFHAVAGYWANGGKTLSSALLVGIYVQVAFFQQYGFTTPPAYLIGALAIQRFRLLSEPPAISSAFWHPGSQAR